jgi:hypothetical protein
LGQQCERLGDWDLAMAVYAQCDHAQARIRQVRVLERSERGPRPMRWRYSWLRHRPMHWKCQALERMLPRLARKLGGPPQRRQRRAAELIELELPASTRHWAWKKPCASTWRRGGQAHYVENTLFNSLFGLLCWEAIFARCPARSSTRSRRAAGPARQRLPAAPRALFERCLGRLDDGSHHQAILDCYSQAGPAVAVRVLVDAQRDLLQQALACLPAAQLESCFVRLLQDIRSNRAACPT